MAKYANDLSSASRRFKGNKHPLCIALIQDLLDRIPSTSSGTYNQADPTAYEKGSMQFRGLEIEYNDCTWGVELTISVASSHMELASIYLSFEGRGEYELIPRDSWDNSWFMRIRKMLPAIKKRYKSKADTYSQDNERWVDPAGGVHYGYAGDPAKMYE
jgi:hypothetical protein